MAGADKLFTEVAGRPLLAHAIAPFQECASIERIVLVMAPLNLKRGRELVERYGFTKAATLVKGGERRQDSVRLGLEALGEREYVAVHDGAAVPIADTVKEVGPEGVVLRTLDRSHLSAVQTPQVFRYELLMRAHREVTEDVTDDAAMVEALGERVRLFEGSRANVKVTTVADLELAAALLIARVEVA
ncbi:MAG: 2-C-methyl-D-erythritol 4-phosphate cytidylyltransferase [Chloroflexi bacterium]|nr:MAG: 2-C-methyl-D-erythritol 4-phosphate cytidylyltransferase [Chloroflexota bacterium]